ncbi:hypothetical protein BaRGS_00040459, partial [Batillaria attramentaria]
GCIRKEEKKVVLTCAVRLGVKAPPRVTRCEKEEVRSSLETKIELPVKGTGKDGCVITDVLNATAALWSGLRVCPEQNSEAGERDQFAKLLPLGQAALKSSALWPRKSSRSLASSADWKAIKCCNSLPREGRPQGEEPRDAGCAVRAQCGFFWLLRPACMETDTEPIPAQH